MTSVIFSFDPAELRSWPAYCRALFMWFHSQSWLNFRGLQPDEQHRQTEHQLQMFEDWMLADLGLWHVECVLGDDGRMDQNATTFHTPGYAPNTGVTVRRIMSLRDWYALAEDLLHDEDWERVTTIFNHFYDQPWLRVYVPGRPFTPTVRESKKFNPVPPKKLGRRNLKPVPLP